MHLDKVSYPRCPICNAPLFISGAAGSWCMRSSCDYDEEGLTQEEIGKEEEREDIIEEGFKVCWRY